MKFTFDQIYKILLTTRDFKGQDLSHLDLSNFDFSNSNLKNANFTLANMDGAQLGESNSDSENLEDFRNKTPFRKKGMLKKKLSHDFLVDQYLKEGKSLGDIAKECGCSRQLVYKRIKYFKIPMMLFFMKF